MCELLKNNDGKRIFTKDSFYSNFIRDEKDRYYPCISDIGHDCNHEEIKKEIEFYSRLIEEVFILSENYL